MKNKYPLIVYYVNEYNEIIQENDIYTINKDKDQKIKRISFKVFANILKKINKTGCEIIDKFYFAFKIANKSDIFYFYGCRTKLESSFIKEFNGQKIEFKFSNCVKQASIEECKHLFN